MTDGNDPASLGERAAGLAEEARAAGYRRLVVLAGLRPWAHQCGEAMLRGAAAHPASALWAGHAAPAGIPSCPPDGLVRYLGSETSCLVVDAHDGLDPDGLGAGLGTVRAGGLILLLVPPLADWPDHPDPQAARLAVDGWRPETMGGRFLRRLRRILVEDPFTVVVEEGRALADAIALPHGRVPAATGDDRCMTADQAAAVAAVVRTATGHRRRPSVLTADRGRGKSAALGIAAAEILAERGGDVVVTGPRRSAVDAVLRHAAERLGVSVHRGRVPAPGGSLRFLLPEELQACNPPPALVLVDEAAAVPTAILADLLRRHSRIVFATTVHGYEGSGRGFSLRFRQVLDAETPRWQEIRLETPIRWRSGDPVEAVLFRALLLDADLPVADNGSREGPVRLERMDRDRLLEDEPLLRDLFGLLVHAHYRTRPMDLRNLLDGPNLFLDLLWQGDVLAGVSLSAEEGGFAGAIAQAIWSGQRRPRGHLLPQSLASHVGVHDGATARALRVMRIAVHPELQRRGLGTRLLQELTVQARAAGYDLAGASFGATAGLIAFWVQAGFRPVRLGMRRDAASGTHSALMVQGLNGRGHSLVTRARERMARDYPLQLADPLGQLEPELALVLVQGLGVSEPAATDWLDALGFACGHRAYEVSMAGLHRVALWALAEPAYAAELGERARRGLMARVLQQQPWADAAAAAGEAGRPGLVNLLRGAVRGLVAARAPADIRRLAAEIAGEADHASSS